MAATARETVREPRVLDLKAARRGQHVNDFRNGAGSGGRPSSTMQPPIITSACVEPEPKPPFRSRGSRLRPSARVRWEALAPP